LNTTLLEYQKQRLVIILIVVFALFVASVNIKSSEKTDAQPMKTVNTISIGTVDVDAVKHIMEFQPTADYIATKISNETTEYKGEVIIPSTLNEMAKLLKEQTVDLYFESPFTIALVDKESGAVPFLLRWKEGVAQYHSIFIVKNNSSIKTLNDFAGKTIAFEAPESTSGYLLPKAYLVQKGFKLVAEPTKNSSNDDDNNIIRYVFAREDKNIPLWIAEGKADIGAISNVDFEQEVYESVKSQLKIIDRTIDVPRYVVSHRSEMEPALVQKIKDVLLNMDKDPEGIEILRNFDNTTRYEEINNEDQLFGPINNMLQLLEQKEVEVGG
jgi:phosphonate transport system substrate-binding protein